VHYHRSNLHENKRRSKHEKRAIHQGLSQAANLGSGSDTAAVAADGSRRWLFKKLNKKVKGIIN
jgi:hypothetical protein